MKDVLHDFSHASLTLQKRAKCDQLKLFFSGFGLYIDRLLSFSFSMLFFGLNRHK